MQQISDWNELRDKIHANAVEHGFWENNPSPEHFMCLVISELMESVEAHRKDRRTDQSLLAHFNDPGDYQPGRTGFTGYFEMYVKDTVEDELADATIRLLDLAGMIELDLSLMPSMVRLCDEQTDLSDFQSATFTEHIFNILREIVKLHVSDAILCSLGSICALAGYMEIDLAKHIDLKMEYNNRRIHKHGKQY